jgi:hypothetical protein
MGMLEMSPEYVVEWRQKCRDLAASQIEGEEILAAAGFRQGGASANYVASKAQLGALVYAGIKMLRKKEAGGLPDKVILAVTPDRIRAFALKVRGRDCKIGEEVASWERAGLTVDAYRGGAMTSLTIASPDGGKASLVGIGVRDDPVSLEVIDALQGAAPADA